MGKILLVAAVFAAFVYLGFWLVERRRAPRTPPPSRPSRPRRPEPPRSVAPDDDEDFLRELDRRRRRAARERKPGPSVGGDRNGAGPTGPGPADVEDDERDRKEK